MSSVTPLTPSGQVQTVTPVGATAIKSDVRKKSRKPRLSEFQKLRVKLALSTEACAELCGVTVRTIQNWDRKGSPAIAMRFLHLYDRQDLAGHGEDWRGFKFSRGKLVCGRLSFTPRNLKQVPHYVDVYNRLEGAKLRLGDGLPPDQAIAIVFGAPAFQAIPALEHQAISVN